MLRARGTNLLHVYLLPPVSPWHDPPSPFLFWDVSKLSPHAAAEDLRSDLALQCYGHPRSTLCGRAGSTAIHQSEGSVHSNPVNDVAANDNRNLGQRAAEMRARGCLPLLTCGWIAYFLISP